MLTCQLDDGDTWMALWMLLAFITVLLLLLVFHCRTLYLYSYTK
uniref:E5 delta n=1 Tax=Human papillomavirus 40 TaxID=10615 RepID=A0A159DZM2_HPV40|nr:E5 delta [human papillomavirus 40]